MAPQSIGRRWSSLVFFSCLSFHAYGADTPKNAAVSADQKKLEFEFSTCTLGAGDNNVFDKGTNETAAIGTEVGLSAQLGVPISSRFGMRVAPSFDVNYRVPFSTKDNVLKLEGGLKIGFETLLAGRSSVPGFKTKNGIFPVLRLGFESKYLLSTTPILGEPQAAYDETADAIATGSDVTASEAGQEGEASGESSGVANQVFANPNTHHRISETVRLATETSKALTLTAEGTVLHDFVDLAELTTNTTFTSVTPGVNFRYKIAPDYFWLSGGYTLDIRSYEEKLATNGAPLHFHVHGVKGTIDIPLRLIKFKLSYEAKFEVVSIDKSMNRTRHQVDLGTEIPTGKYLSIIVDGRVTDTTSSTGPDALRFVGLGGLKFKM